MTTSVAHDVRTVLKQSTVTKESGCLKVNDKNISWRIYIRDGVVKYVEGSIQDLDQLKYYLHCLKLESVLAAVSELPGWSNQQEKPDFYGRTISWLLSKNYLDLSQGIKLIEYINQDLLRECLWVKEDICDWLEDYSAPAWMSLELQDALSLDITNFLQAEETILKQWQESSAGLLSVHQRPYFALGWKEKDLPSSGSLEKKMLLELSKVLRGKTSIRQLSILLRKDELSVSKVLSPYIDSKIICLRTPKAPLELLPNIPRFENSSAVASACSTELKKIVCIDDSPTILGEIQRFLSTEKFAVTAIEDPIKAASSIFKIKPDLILLDITMPKINGYKLCGLLRSSGKCDLIPIIMVTGNTGLIDKARAKLAGATDYFTKPFTKEGLNKIIDKYLQ